MISEGKQISKAFTSIFFIVNYPPWIEQLSPIMGAIFGLLKLQKKEKQRVN